MAAQSLGNLALWPIYDDAIPEPEANMVWVNYLTMRAQRLGEKTYDELTEELRGHPNPESVFFGLALAFHRGTDIANEFRHLFDIETAKPTPEGRVEGVDPERFLRAIFKKIKADHVSPVWQSGHGDVISEKKLSNEQAQLLELTGHRMRKLRESDLKDYRYWAKDAFSVAQAPMALVSLAYGETDATILLPNEAHDEAFGDVSTSDGVSKRWPKKLAQEANALMSKGQYGHHFFSISVASSGDVQAFLFELDHNSAVPLNFAVLFLTNEAPTEEAVGFLGHYIQMVISECGGFPTLLSAIDGYEKIAAKLAKSLKNTVKQTDTQDAQSVHGELITSAGDKRVRYEVEPMSLKETNPVSPVFEGTLSREAAVEALKTVHKLTGLSQRKFAVELGITDTQLRKTFRGDATIDSITSLLAKAGYTLQSTLVPIQNN